MTRRADHSPDKFKATLTLKTMRLPALKLVGVVLAAIGLSSAIMQSVYCQTKPQPLANSANRLNQADQPDSAITSSPEIKHALTKPANPSNPCSGQNYGMLPLSFESNQGQTSAQVRFLARGKGYNLFLTATEAVIALDKPNGKRKAGVGVARTAHVTGDKGKASIATVRMRLEGARTQPRIIGVDQLPGRSNYFIGNDPQKWKTNVINYSKVKYEDIYPGIDIVYYGNQRQLEYDFHVAPSADPNIIKLRFEGATSLRINREGDLALRIDRDEIRQMKPSAYQVVNGSRQTVSCHYVLKSKNEVGFALGPYDESKPLVIDPLLLYSTYLGGNDFDIGDDIAVDSDGNAYVVGTARSADFPTTPGAFQTTFRGAGMFLTDAFVTKLNPEGTGLVYSTYIGSTGSGVGDAGIAIAIDSSKNVYVTGQTDGPDFPVTAGVVQSTYGGEVSDAFVAKLNATGNALIYSTFLGGSGRDQGLGIAVDSVGSAYVTGSTASPNFPVANAFQPTIRAAPPYPSDAFVTKLNPTGSALVYSTYLGSGIDDPGAGPDSGRDIAIDSSGNAYIVGITKLTVNSATGAVFNNFPTTPGAFRTTACDTTTNLQDMFVTKLNATGNALVYSTFLCGGSIDVGESIAVDSAGKAYVTGATISTDFPTTAGAFQVASGGGPDIFVTKLSASGGSLEYSSYLGGSSSDEGEEIALDAMGNAYVTGRTTSTNFPQTADALSGTGDGAFVSKVNPTGSALLYSTRLGGGSSGFGIVASPCPGSVYVTGAASVSSTFITTPGAFQTTLNGATRAFITKIDTERNTPPPVAPDATGMGPNAVDSSGFYKFPAAIDPDVLPGRETELWAQIYRPATLSSSLYPLVIFLHGNHGTCGFVDTSLGIRIDNRIDYTTTGHCPQIGDPGYPGTVNYVVTPNHEGYKYLAERLASYGYIVVSINANRGITSGAGVSGDAALILARGRLVLKHLQKLSQWHISGGTPASVGANLMGKIDFSNVGLLGHSRGGEGVRAAYNLYRESTGPNWRDLILQPVTFKGIFEIGPTDRDDPSAPLFNTLGTAWNVLLPMCDRDVWNLRGVRAFDRMMKGTGENPAKQKSTFTVWGANHNYYNTEWMVNEFYESPSDCLRHTPLFTGDFPGSAPQRQTAIASVIAFFRANVGMTPTESFNQNFDPRYELPGAVKAITRIDRGYTPSPKSSITKIFEDFTRAEGTNTTGTVNNKNNITMTHEGVPDHDSGLKSGKIFWTAAGTDTYFQSNWRAPGSGNNITSYQTLDFRISRQLNDTLNSSDSTNLSIQLVMANGSLSQAVSLCKYADLRGPVGTPRPVVNPAGIVTGYVDIYHSILQTVRIPLTDFIGANLSQVRGVRFTFNGTPTGAIYLANIVLAK